jgi:hypothetical protein
MKRVLAAVFVAALLVPAAATAKGGPGEKANVFFTPVRLTTVKLS